MICNIMPIYCKYCGKHMRKAKRHGFTHIVWMRADLKNSVTSACGRNGAGGKVMRDYMRYRKYFFSEVPKNRGRP